MKQAFQRAIAFCLAVMLLIGSSSAMQALAAEPKLNVTKRTIWVGGKIFDFNVSNVSTKTYKIVFSVADPTMVRCDAKNGKVRALSVGKNAQTTLTATITNKSTGKLYKTLTATIYVKESASEVEITNKELVEEALKPGDSVTLVGTMYNAAGDASTERKNYVTDYRQWVSSNPSVVSINEKTGRLTAKKQGSAVITLRTFVESDFSGEATAEDRVPVVVIGKSATATPTATPTPTAVPEGALTKVTQKGVNTVTAEFSSDMSKKLTPSSFTLRDITGYSTQLVNTVTFSTDGKTAEITMYSDFINGNVYQLNVGDQSQQFTASAGEVARIVLEGGTVYTGKATDLKIVLYDANNIDVTTDTKLYNVQLTVSPINNTGYVNGFIDSATRQLTLFTTGDRCMVTATYNTYQFLTDGTQVTYQSTAMFTAVEEPPATVTSIVINVGATPDWTSTNARIAIEDTNYYIFAKATFSDGTTKLTAAGTGELTFQSTDNSKLIVSSQNGQLIPISLGVATVLVYDGTRMIGSLPVTVSAKRIAATIALDKQSVTLTRGLAADETSIALTVRDQYGMAFESATAGAYIEQLTTNLPIVPLTCYNGTISLNGAMYTTAGTYQYKITCADRVQTFVVRVVTAGNATSYRVALSATTVDVSYTAGDSIEKSLDFSMFAYDNAGNKVSIVDATTVFNNLKFGYTITKAGDTEASVATPFTGKVSYPLRQQNNLTITQAAAGTYMIRIYLSSSGSTKTSLYATQAFTVTNSQKAPTLVQKASTSNGFDDASIMSCFTINGSDYAAVASQYVVEKIDYQMISGAGSYILWVKQINLREMIGGYYIVHQIPLTGVTLTVK